MKLINQPELDLFFERALNDVNLYPFITTSKRVFPWKVYEDDWQGLMLTNSQNTFIADISFDRTCHLDFRIALYAFSSFAAGQGVFAVKEIIERYKPTSINSSVHSTNVKSLILHDKIFGPPWGIEPLGAWNMKTGKFEDLVYFKKIF